MSVMDNLMYLKDDSNVLIKENQARVVQLEIRKKYDPVMYLFFMIALVFIYVMAFILIPMARENNPSSSNNVLNSILMLCYLVGGVMLVGAVHEILKREWIKIRNNHLIIESCIFNWTVSKDSYQLNSVKNLKPLQPPGKGWKIVEKYEDADRKYTTWSNDMRKVYPSICFQCKGKEVSFAHGLTHEEALVVIDIIKKHRNPPVYA
jgi:hypothetical protein